MVANRLQEDKMAEVQVRRWTRAEYERLAEVGLLRADERVELIEGEIVEMAPQLGQHTTGILLTEDALRKLFGVGHQIRVQCPLALGDYSEPESDVAVVAGGLRDFRDHHPTSALLVVEVADSTLAFDRDTKGGLYARAGILEYWILNLVERQVEVYRDPIALASARFGFAYRSRTIATSGDVLRALARPDDAIAVADFLP
jgi:Uma2 family endonuclease